MTLTVGSGTVTVPAAETVTSTGDALAIFQSTSGTLINYGDMTLSTQAGVTGTGGAFPGAITTTSEPDPQALFQNFGAVTISTGDTAVGVNFATFDNSNQFSLTSGDLATGASGGLVNSGTFSVQGVSGANGVSTGNPGSFGGLVQNQGSMTVSSDGSSYGVFMENGGEFDNSGPLNVAGSTAYGVSMNGSEGYSTNYGVINNAGSIIVTGGETYGIYFTGVYDNLTSGQYNIINSGSIKAQTAISTAADTQVAINNSGLIEGDVALGNANNTLLNTGVIQGDVVVGDGNNSISSEGAIYGTITVGAGNNSISTGSEDNTFILGGGADAVNGGGGHNIVEVPFDETKVTLTHQPNGSWLLDAGGVTDTLTNIQEVVFTNGSQELASGRTVAEMADFTGSGHSGILWQDTAGDVSTWNVSGSTPLSVQPDATYNAAPAASWQLVGTMDFTGDGQSDILWRNGANGQIALWHEASPGVFSSEYVSGAVATSSSIGALGDFNGDGMDDILWRNSNGSVTEWRSTGSGFTQNTFSDAVSTAWHIQGVGDFDGDGKEDILWRNADGSLSIWSGASSGFSENSYFHGPVATSWHVAGVGDFNGDGKDDILWWNNNGGVSVWTSTGSGFTENTYYNTVASGWKVVGAFDFNGDGNADILWHNANGQISIWESTGSGFTAVYTGSAATNWTPLAMHFDIV